MLETILPLLVCVIGLIVWAVASTKSNPPPSSVTMEIGRTCYKYGLLVTLFVYAARAVTFSPMAIVGLPLAVCVFGLLVWILGSNAVLKEAGRIAFGFGLLVSLFEVATHAVRL
jgi:hypothetical protein